MRSVLVLTLTGFFSALLLFGTNKLTEGPVRKAVERVKVEALRQIFPFEFSDGDINRATGADGRVYFEIKDRDGGLKGVAVEVSGDKGYSGRIKVLLAVSAAGGVYDYSVLAHQETPGLGNKITEPAFRRQFKDRKLDGFNWKVKKDGGDVDAVTAATISSRAITEILERGLKLVLERYPQERKK
ncbi:MAG: electron transporter RnfG [Elusimicrobia bacterium CG08_land_8_20_14_0_20_59_10]|nr:MAG: electron transporter RnfG [Elusimicrobia bacterium CG08_land_8_20_14_0_20_59_10]